MQWSLPSWYLCWCQDICNHHDDMRQWAHCRSSSFKVMFSTTANYLLWCNLNKTPFMDLQSIMWLPQYLDLQTWKINTNTIPNKVHIGWKNGLKSNTAVWNLQSIRFNNTPWGTHSQVNKMRLTQNGWHCADDIFKPIFLNENNCISSEICSQWSN